MSDPIFRVRDVFVGHTAEGKRVYIDAELSAAPGEWQTVEHKTVQAPVTLSASHAVRREGLSAGYAGLFRVVRPAPGYTLDEVHELGQIGERWHLNTMKAACAHMEIPEGKSVSELLDMGLVCPESGYKFGHEHLTEELPDEVAERFKELASKGEVHPQED